MSADRDTQRQGRCLGTVTSPPAAEPWACGGGQRVSVCRQGHIETGAVSGDGHLAAGGRAVGLRRRTEGQCLQTGTHRDRGGVWGRSPRRRRPSRGPAEEDRGSVSADRDT